MGALLAASATDRDVLRQARTCRAPAGRQLIFGTLTMMTIAVPSSWGRCRRLSRGDAERQSPGGAAHASSAGRGQGRRLATRSVRLATILAALVGCAWAQTQDELATPPATTIAAVGNSAFSDQERMAMASVARAMRQSGLWADIFSDYSRPGEALPSQQVFYFRRAFDRLPTGYSASNWELALIKLQRAESAKRFHSPEQSKDKITAALEQGDLAGAYDELMRLSSHAAATR